ncbi:hypothetical protein GN109_05730 [Collimonas pratensis]|uniref:hypothetical protein n=1 Tax=Collimonas pratensis TaxID=279113 RepID=UPI00143DF542|nr:hypothetical protein [Collimonas pratensis]NKI68914.1 hypothetical protein [Collimonas pratensis]
MDKHTAGLDHGILNVPLAKRGNLDAQIDAYKAEQAAAAQEKREAAIATNRENKAVAKVLLAELIAFEGLVDNKAARAKISRKELIEILTGWAKWEPAKIIKAHKDWMAQ